MNKTRFKEGDKVRVKAIQVDTDGDGEAPEGYTDVFVPKMEKYIGKEATVYAVSPNGQIQLTGHYGIDKWNFVEDWLEEV